MSTQHHYATDDGVLTVYSWSVSSGDSQATLVHLDEARGRVIVQTFDDDMESINFPSQWAELVDDLVPEIVERDAAGVVIFGVHGLAIKTQFIDK